MAMCCCELAAQFLALAEKQGATVPLMIGHRLMGTSLLLTGDIAEAERIRSDRALRSCRIARSVALWMRDLARYASAAVLIGRWLLWLLGYPEAALADMQTQRSRMRARSAKPPTLDVCAGSSHSRRYLAAEITDSERAGR